MPNILTADAMLQEAQQLKSQAIELLNSPELRAEDLETIDRLLAEAEEKVSNSQRLKDLKNRAASIQGDANQSKDRGSKFDSFGQYLLAVRAASKGQQDPRLVYFDSEVPDSERKDLAESVGSTGGYLVPQEFRAELLQYAGESSIVRPRAMVIPMSRRTLEVPALKQDGTATDEPHWFGGMVAYWTGEAETIQETEPAFRNITLTAHELTAVTHTSNNLLADSAISLQALLTGPRGFPGVIAWKEDYAFLRGDGVGKPLGVLNAPATYVVTRANAGTVSYTDLVELYSHIIPSANAVWVAHMSLRKELMLMAGPVGATDYAGTYLWGDAASGVPSQLLGLPIIFTEKVPSLGSPGDIGLYDFSHYYVGDRQATTIDSTDQNRWLRNQTSWKVVHRVDGQPWLNLPFTLADGSFKVSPFVMLGAAA